MINIAIVVGAVNAFEFHAFFLKQNGQPYFIVFDDAPLVGPALNILPESPEFRA